MAGKRRWHRRRWPGQSPSLKSGKTHAALVGLVGAAITGMAQVGGHALCDWNSGVSRTHSVDIDDLWYYGHVDAAQLAWLRQDVAADDGSTIVTFNHIPFFTAALSVFGYFDDPPAPTLIEIGDRTVFRHVVSNAFEVFKILAPHHYSLALGGHNHAAEKLTFEIQGLNVRFHQTAAVVGPNTYAPMPIPSGVTFYSVSGGVIDDGRFVPLGETE